MRFYCTSTGPIGGLNCEVLLQLPSARSTHVRGQGVVIENEDFTKTLGHK